MGLFTSCFLGHAHVLERAWMGGSVALPPLIEKSLFSFFTEKSMHRAYESLRNKESICQIRAIIYQVYLELLLFFFFILDRGLIVHL